MLQELQTTDHILYLLCGRMVFFSRSRTVHIAGAPSQLRRTVPTFTFAEVKKNSLTMASVTRLQNTGRIMWQLNLARVQVMPGQIQLFYTAPTRSEERRVGKEC